MEYFDVYDNKRNKLNYIKERGKELKDNEFNKGVEIYITSNNKLLLTQRSVNKSHPLEWEVPGGCSIANETSLDTIKREIKEEINLEINLNSLKYIGTKLYKKNYVDIYTIDINNLDINKLKKQDEEINDIKLVTKEEFNNLKIVSSVSNRFNSFKDLINLYW